MSSTSAFEGRAPMGARPEEECDATNQVGHHCPAPVPVVLALKPWNPNAVGDRIHGRSSEVRPLKKPRAVDQDGVHPGFVPIPAQYQPVNYQSPMYLNMPRTNRCSPAAAPD